MQSSTSPTNSDAAPARRVASTLTVWNRRLHYFIGLYLLLFLWLFSFTGLLLNHPQWSFAEFWPTRTQTKLERQIELPPPGDDLVQARDIMRQLGIRGEIEWTKTRADLTRLDFRVARPGHIFEVSTDLTGRSAAVQQIGLNTWGVMRLLHSFTGVRMADEKNSRDWSMTTLWALSMDALALGMIFMVLSSLYMWWVQSHKRWLGLGALSLGTLCCALFAIGLRWLF
ncbi:MAG TPA: PepSY domain-containing protein [Paludibaculum sp.]|jgi:hypothetical protein